MQRIKVGQRQISVRGPALQKLLQQRTTQRNRANQRRRNLRRPVALLIPWQQVAGQGKAEHQRDQEQA